MREVLLSSHRGHWSLMAEGKRIERKRKENSQFICYPGHRGDGSLMEGKYKYVYEVYKNVYLTPLLLVKETYICS
jgi:hypothetical protein